MHLWKAETFGRGSEEDLNEKKLTQHSVRKELSNAAASAADFTGKTISEFAGPHI